MILAGLDICGENYSMPFQAIPCKLLKRLAKRVVTGWRELPQIRPDRSKLRRMRQLWDAVLLTRVGGSFVRFEALG